ncbi:MAG: TonB-dependent receptor [Myxococcales bacterium]|nr:TonB-dependent receptor [Myxococcales bacterium]
MKNVARGTLCGTFIPLLVSLPFLLLIAPAIAEPTESSEFRTVITPTRQATTEFDTDRSVFALDDTVLEDQAPVDVPDSLQDIPGVMIQRTNRGAGAPVLRGLIGPQNVILIDGLRFNNSTFRTGPNQYLALVDPAALEAVEIVLGPGSVLYGSDAMGGVMNLLPRAVPHTDGLWGRAMGQFATADLATTLSLDAGGKIGPFSGYIGGTFRDFGALSVPSSTDPVPLSEYEQRDVRARFNADLGDGWTLSGTYLANGTDDAGRIDQLGRGDVRIYDNTDHFAYLDTRFSGTDWLHGARIAIVYHRTTETAHRNTCTVNSDKNVARIDLCSDLSDLVITKKRVNEDTVDTIGALITATAGLFDDRLLMTLGAESYTDFVGSFQKDANKSEAGYSFKRATRGSFSDDSRYTLADGFFFAEGRPLEVPEVGDLSLTAGVRISYVNSKAPDVPDLGTVSYDHIGVVATGGARFLFQNHYNIFANFSQGFRAPNLQETTVLGDTGSTFEVPNDDLGPEKSNSIEIGFKMHREWMRWVVGFHYTWITDYISRENTTFDGQNEIDGKQVVRRVNAGEATYLGVESSIEIGPFLGISVFGTVGWLQGDVTDQNGETQPARRVPPIGGIGGLRYEALEDRLSVEVYARWAASQDRLNPEDEADLRICEDPKRPGVLLTDCSGTDGYVTPGLRARYRISDVAKVFAQFENLSDSAYRIHGSGTDAPGINAEVGAILQF